MQTSAVYTWRLAFGFGVCLGVSACGADDKPKPVPCPEGTMPGVVLPCSCADAGMGMQLCQMDLTLSACSCAQAAAGGAGGGSGTTPGAAGSAEPGGGGLDGGAVISDDDAGTSPNVGSDAGTTTSADGGAVVVKPPKAPTDGAQLSACADSGDCDGSLECYDAGGATPVGYCTETCSADSDCTGLGAGYSCSTTGLLGGTRYCRFSCDAPEDKSCPKLMSCVAVQGGYRCLYDAKDVGSGEKKLFEQCTGSGDCEGDYVCYAGGVQPGLIGGMSYQGYCTQSCGDDNDCTENPTTGEVAPSCTGDGTCGLPCGVALPLGNRTCPDGMSCVPSNLLGAHCLYPAAANGGV